MVGRSYISDFSPTIYLHTPKEPQVPQIILEDEELSRASESLIAYIEGRDAGTRCGIPHIYYSCPCTLNV
jgi:hypothetical protein